MSRKHILLTIGMICIVLAVANVIASSAVANTGGELQKIYERETALNAQLSELERSVSSKKAFNYLSAKAVELGLVSPASTITLSTPAPVALMQ